MPTVSILPRMMARLTQIFHPWIPMSPFTSLASALWHWLKSTLPLAWQPNSRSLCACEYGCKRSPSLGNSSGSFFFFAFLHVILTQFRGMCIRGSLQPVPWSAFCLEAGRKVNAGGSNWGEPLSLKLQRSNPSANDWWRTLNCCTPASTYLEFTQSLNA